jgi:hypothetical protein
MSLLARPGRVEIVGAKWMTVRKTGALLARAGSGNLLDLAG